MAKAVYFYGTNSDVLGWLQQVEQKVPLSYRRTGSQDFADIKHAESASEIEGFGEARFGDWALESKFLVLPQRMPFSLRTVELANAPPRYFVDQLINPASVILAPGGEYDKQVILLGELATVSSDRESLRLYKLMFRILGQSFSKHANVYVGREARERATSGIRLTGRIAAPKVNDFQIE